MGIKAQNGGFLGQIKAKMKALPRRFWDDAFLVAAIFLIALAAFGMGRLSVIMEGDRGLVVTTLEGSQAETTSKEVKQTGKYVVSITGSKYHLPWCPGAQNIKEENKIWFESREDAEIAGYEPAVNCPGL